MSIENHTNAPGANIHVEHFCDHVDADGLRCREWGCYGYEDSEAVTHWYCPKHQPLDYRGLPPHGARLQ